MVALFVALIQFLTTLVTFGFIRPKKSRFPAVLNAIHSVYDELHMLNSALDAPRALILKTENGGGIPQLGRALFSSVLYEAFTADSGSVRKGWQKEQIDEGYTGMLTDMVSKGIIVVKTASLPDGQLKTLYEAYKVTHSIVALIALEERRMIYLSVNLTEKSDMMVEDPEVTEKVRSSVNRLRNLFDTRPGEL